MHFWEKWKKYQKLYQWLKNSIKLKQEKLWSFDKARNALTGKSTLGMHKEDIRKT